MYSYYVNQNIYLTIKYLCVIVQSIYLFMIYRANRAHEQEAVHPDIFPGVSSFYFVQELEV